MVRSLKSTAFFYSDKVRSTASSRNPGCSCARGRTSRHAGLVQRRIEPLRRPFGCRSHSFFSICKLPHHSRKLATFRLPQPLRMVRQYSSPRSAGRSNKMPLAMVCTTWAACNMMILGRVQVLWRWRTLALDGYPTIGKLCTNFGERMPSKPLAPKNQPNNFNSTDLRGVIRYMEETGQLMVERRGRLCDIVQTRKMALILHLRSNL
jgi:hypothetical protein